MTTNISLQQLLAQKATELFTQKENTGKKVENKPFNPFVGTTKHILLPFGKVWQREANSYESDNKSRVEIWVAGKDNTNYDFLKLVTNGKLSEIPATGTSLYKQVYKPLVDVVKDVIESKEYYINGKISELKDCVPQALQADLQTLYDLHRNAKIRLSIDDNQKFVTAKIIPFVPKK